MQSEVEKAQFEARHGALDYQLLDDIFASPSNGMIVLDEGFHILRVGYAVCRLLGYEQQELIGKLFSTLLLPEDRDAASLRLQFLNSTAGQAYEAENQFAHKSGSSEWVIVSVAALGNLQQAGMPAYILHITSIRKQKLAEAKTEEALSRWSFALDSAGQGVWDCHVPTDTWTYSDAWLRMRGIPENESLDFHDDNWLKEIHPDDQALVIDKIKERHKPNMGEVSYEYRQLHRDGRWIWILARGRCIEFLPDGRPKRIIGTDTDITLIKHRESELGELSKRLELAISTSQVGIWKFDVVQAQTYWDGRCCEIFEIEYQQTPLAALTWENLVHPEDLALATEICRKGLAAREDYSLDYRIVLPSGKLKYIRCRARFPKQSLLENAVVGVMWDVTADIEKAEAFKTAKLLAENRTVDLEVARTHLEHASLHDALTGLPNRRHLDSALTKFHVGSKQGQSLTLLHVDLDRFKQINDTKGHAAGDAVLVQIASLLRNQFRGSDLVARIGGDEFVVLLSPSPDRYILERMVDRVINLSRQPIMWQGHECRCGVSIGIAESTGTVDPKQLFVNADIALYRAKNSGRNCAVFFTGSLQAEIIANKQCADDLQQALERGEFVPFYQPIFNARTYDISSLEALVRWQHPKRGMLSPDKFLNVAAELNILDAIDRVILEQSLSHLKTWDSMSLKIPKISVNVSAKRLSSKVLLESLLSLGINPGRVSFELLESIFLDDDDDINTKNITELKKLGIGIDIDDFGTGHASIVSLLRLNPNCMKIDRQLTRNIVENEAQCKLVHSLIEIGKSQNIEVCAEGVETAEQAQILRSLGCDYLQGFYFAKPMKAGEIAAFAKEQSWRKNAPALNDEVISGKTLRSFMQKIGFSKVS